MSTRVFQRSWGYLGIWLPAFSLWSALLRPTTQTGFLASSQQRRAAKTNKFRLRATWIAPFSAGQHWPHCFRRWIELCGKKKKFTHEAKAAKFVSLWWFRDWVKKSFFTWCCVTYSFTNRKPFLAREEPFSKKKKKTKNSNLQVTVQVRAPGVSPEAELRLFPITWGSREGWGLVWIQGRWAAFPPPSSSIQDRQASPASSRMTEGKSGTQQSLL